MKSLLICPLLILLFVSVTLHAQPVSQLDKLYDDSHVARIDVTIEPAFLAYMYANPWSDSIHHASFKFVNNNINETVQDIGFRIRGNTSRNSKKKSFKISFNDFVPGRDFYSVDKLNLNGEHNDPSIIRSKLSFDHFRSIGVPASRASHVALYINNKYYGLYVSVEHVDDQFLNKNFRDDTGNLWKCLYGADLRYRGTNPQTYKDLNNNGIPCYELTTNEGAGDYSKLVRLISVITNTSSALLPDSLEKLLDVKGVLQYFAMNTLLGGWDDYWSLMNNYYLYYSPSEDKFTLIPYDYDNTFGVDWFNINWTLADPYNKPKVASGERPLAERLIANVQYKNLYTHFLQFYRSNVMLMNFWESRLDSLRSSITTAALADSFRTLDYGFTSGDFFNSFGATSYSNQHIKFGLKQFVNFRNASLPAQLSYGTAQPIVYAFSRTPENPRPADSVYIHASGFSAVGISEMKLYYTRTGSPTPVIYPMVFNPVLQTKIVEEADRYTAVLPPLGPNVSGSYYFYIKDTQGSGRFYPRVYPVKIASSGLTGNSIVINEFMADNAGSVLDPSGQADDWLELYNPTQAPVLLTGKYLSDNPANLKKWRITQESLFIQAGEHIIVWCDEDLTQEGLHANFKLSKGGEFLAVTDTNGITVQDSLTFGMQKTDTTFGRFPDGGIEWGFMSPSAGMTNNPTSIADLMQVPQDYMLEAYPNPFNPETNLIVRLLQSGQASLVIYSLLGSKIREFTLSSNQDGEYRVHWDGKNNEGQTAAAGIYIARLHGVEHTASLKLVLLK